MAATCQGLPLPFRSGLHSPFAAIFIYSLSNKMLAVWLWHSTAWPHALFLNWPPGSCLFSPDSQLFLGFDLRGFFTVSSSPHGHIGTFPPPSILCKLVSVTLRQKNALDILRAQQRCGVCGFCLLSSAVFSKRCQNSREMGKWSSREGMWAAGCWHSSSLRLVDSFKIKLLFLEP